MYTVGPRFVLVIIRRVFAGLPVTDLVYGGKGFGFSSSIPGMVRMFGYWCVGAYLSWLAFLWISLPRAFGRRGYVILLLLASTVIYLFLVQFSRAPLMICTVLTLFVLINRCQTSADRGKRASRRQQMSLVGFVIAMIFVLIGMTSLTSVARPQTVERSHLDTYLGVTNTVLSVRTTTKWTYGFETVLAPLTFLPRGLGISASFPQTDAQWITNPAGNLLTYSFQDFGYFGFVIYAFLGFVIGWVRRKRISRPNSLLWATMYLWSLAGLLSIWIVPLFRGPDFWCGVLGSLVIDSVIGTSVHRIRLFRG